MSADTLLSRLKGVKCTGPGRWLAQCSAHADKRPSLSVRELDNGRTLVKCWADCAVADVLAAVGLGWDAIMPPRAIGHHVKRERRPFSAHDVLMALETELTIASVTLLDIGHGRALSAVDRERALLASQRIRAAAEMAVSHD